MKKAVFLVLVLAVAAFAWEGGYGGFMFSYMMPDLSALSAPFEANGLPAMDEPVLTYGGGAWGSPGGVLVGGWGFGGSRTLDGTDVKVKLSYGGGFFEAGYFINFWKGLGVAPVLGIGGTSIEMELRPMLGDVEFDSLLANPGRTSLLEYSTFTLAPNLVINIPIKFLALQLKGGYMWSPFQGKWKLGDGAQLWDGPEINPSGIFATACLMFGGSD